MRKILTVLIVIISAAAALAAPSAHASQGVEEVMAGMRSPDDIARFFSQEMTYMMTFPDRAHSPEETIEAMAGDCEDLAVLASAMLTRMGIENQVMIINFNGLKVAHAVCAWKEKSGYYSFISNKELHRTGQLTAEGAIRKFYPDCRAIASIDPKMYVNTGGGSEISAAKSYRGAELMTSLDPRRSTRL